jgi:hypothetical protein
MDLGVVRIVPENFRQVLGDALDQLRRREVQIDRYAEVHQGTFVNRAFFNRKKGWIVRRYVEKVGGSVTHVNSPFIRRVTGKFLPFLFR